MDVSFATFVSLPGLIAVCLLFALPTAGCGDTAPPPLPEGNAGIAARYPGDAGIEKDRAVVFHADFEDCRTREDVFKQWGVMYNGEHLRITEEPAKVNGGRRALEITIPQQDQSLSVDVGHNLAVTQDVLFLRFYTKFDPDYDVPRTSSHNGGTISAGYYPGGRATPGIRADGRNKYLANFETEIVSPGHPAPPGPLNVYIYHPEQRSDYGDHFYPTGVVQPNTSLPGNFGPSFVPRPDIVPERGRWYCFEYMLKANTPGRRDGRVACWVDGKLIADFPNLRFRDIDTLKIDRFGVGLYIAKNTRRENTKWYDDVVAATSYIGPRVEGKGK
jgi:hypothetical protein